MSRLSQQQQRFADLILEGRNQTDAYKQAGYKCANDNVAAVSASELVRNPKVVAYMTERRQEAAQSLQIDLQWLINKGVAILEAAEKQGAYGPAISALKEVGILTGERIEKSQRENINRNVDEYDDAELLAITRASSAGVAGPARRSQEPDSVH
jgi:hypothetical protein